MNRTQRDPKSHRPVDLFPFDEPCKIKSLLRDLELTLEDFEVREIENSRQRALIGIEDRKAARIEKLRERIRTFQEGE